jgi:tetratricopeptide (TPR) repeat protein
LCKGALQKSVFSQKKNVMPKFLALALLLIVAVTACTPNLEKYRDHLEMGIADMYYSRFESALENFNQALRYNPESHEAHFYRGNVYRNLNNTEAAMSDYNEAIALNPSYADAYYNRGLLNEFIHNNVRAGCEDFLMAEHLGKQNIGDRTRWCK